jgi:hypothetical protein
VQPTWVRAAFFELFHGFKLVPAKWRSLVPPQAANAGRWAGFFSHPLFVKHKICNEEILGENRKIDILKANPIYHSGIENRYRTLGEDMGSGWSIGKQYKSKKEISEPEATETKYQCDIVEHAAQPALTIRTWVSPVAIAPTIGESASAILQYAGERGYIPTGPLFVAYHGFDGREQDIEMGFPFKPGIEGRDNIKVSEIPEGKSATYHHIWTLSNLG